MWWISCSVRPVRRIVRDRWQGVCEIRLREGSGSRQYWANPRKVCELAHTYSKACPSASHASVSPALPTCGVKADMQVHEGGAGRGGHCIAAPLLGHLAGGQQAHRVPHTGICMLSASSWAGKACGVLPMRRSGSGTLGRVDYCPSHFDSPQYNGSTLGDHAGMQEARRPVVWAVVRCTAHSLEITALRALMVDPFLRATPVALPPSTMTCTPEGVGDDVAGGRVWWARHEEWCASRKQRMPSARPWCAQRICGGARCGSVGCGALPKQDTVHTTRLIHMGVKVQLPPKLLQAPAGIMVLAGNVRGWAL